MTEQAPITRDPKKAGASVAAVGGGNAVVTAVIATWFPHLDAQSMGAVFVIFNAIASTLGKVARDAQFEADTAGRSLPGWQRFLITLAGAVLG